MAWIKIPLENHPLFMAALPHDPRVSTVKMFGGIAGMVNGNMFGGLFARSTVLRLSAADQKAVLALKGAEPFDPMGNGRVMNDMVLLPEPVTHDPKQLRDWLRRALDYTAAQPPKTKKPAKKAAKRKRG
jgi:TfoX/Sxy family transcriptional regulator of competence genes